MRAGALDGHPRNLIHALTVERAVINVGNVLDSRGGGDELEHGAGGKGRRQTAVDIGPLRRLRVRVQRVNGRAGDHAQQLPGAVIAQQHRALPAVQRLIGHLVQLRVNIQPEIDGLGAGGAGEQAEIVQLVPEAGQGPGAGAAPVVPGDVVTGDPRQLIVGIGVGCGVKGGQKGAVPVGHHAGGAGVGPGKIQGPVPPLVHVAQHIDHHSPDNQRCDQQHGDGPVGDFFHGPSSSVPSSP